MATDVHPPCELTAHEAEQLAQRLARRLQGNHALVRLDPCPSGRFTVVVIDVLGNVWEACDA